MKTKEQIEKLNSVKGVIKSITDSADSVVYELMLWDEYDDNYYGEGTLLLCGQEIDIESIWTDADKHINIHVNHEDFEGDVLMKSLSVENQLRVVDVILKHD